MPISTHCIAPSCRGIHHRYLDAALNVRTQRLSPRGLRPIDLGLLWIAELDATGFGGGQGMACALLLLSSGLSFDDMVIVEQSKGTGHRCEIVTPGLSCPSRSAARFLHHSDFSALPPHPRRRVRPPSEVRPIAWPCRDRSSNSRHQLCLAEYPLGPPVVR